MEENITIISDCFRDKILAHVINKKLYLLELEEGSNTRIKQEGKSLVIPIKEAKKLADFINKAK